LWAASVLAAHTSIESHDLVDQVEALGTVGDQEHRPVFRRRQHVANECLRSRTSCSLSVPSPPAEQMTLFK
jgi:hypothetical protein